MRAKPAALELQDLVLIHVEQKPAFFARVENINPDYKRGWWQVKLFVLTLPLRVVTWIIDDDQIRGAEFTMSGTPIRIEKVVPPTEPEESPQEEPVEKPELGQATRKQARILSFSKKSEA